MESRIEALNACLTPLKKEEVRSLVEWNNNRINELEKMMSNLLNSKDVKRILKVGDELSDSFEDQITLRYLAFIVENNLYDKLKVLCQKPGDTKVEILNIMVESRMLTRRELSKYVDLKHTVGKIENHAIDIEKTINRYVHKFLWLGEKIDALFVIAYLISKYEGIVCNSLSGDGEAELVFSQLQDKPSEGTFMYLNFGGYYLWYPVGLVELIQKCKQAGKKFLLFPLPIHLRNGDYHIHENILVYNLGNDVVERYDPQFGVPLAEWEMRSYNALNVLLERLFHGYIGPETVCITGLQTIEERVLMRGTTEKYTGHYCGAWNFYYADLRLKYPDEGIAEVYRRALRESGNNAEKLRLDIKKYAKTLVDKREEIINKSPISEKIKKEMRTAYHI